MSFSSYRQPSLPPPGRSTMLPARPPTAPVSRMPSMVPSSMAGSGSAPAAASASWVSQHSTVLMISVGVVLFSGLAVLVMYFMGVFSSTSKEGYVLLTASSALAYSSSNSSDTTWSTILKKLQGTSFTTASTLTTSDLTAHIKTDSENVNVIPTSAAIYLSDTVAATWSSSGTWSTESTYPTTSKYFLIAFSATSRAMSAEDMQTALSKKYSTSVSYQAYPIQTDNTATTSS